MTELIRPLKIQPRHLDRLAVVYVRQSHPQQQIKHPESVATQRRLRERIQQWGWPEDRIRVLEGDLGKTGTSTVGRDDFAWLVSEVTLNHVGLVAGFQINRLAREDEAICHLIKICSLFDTLLADQDGLYHPQDFNDRLVLTIKGLVGGVELYQIQQRMQHGRLERARRGEWLGATPLGYVLGPNRKLALDPDEQVQHAVRQIFEQFERLGSISALLRYFHEHGLRLPHREPTVAVPGQIDWRRPHRETVRNLLRHPAYAGAFTWGRRRVDPQRALPGRRGTGRVVLLPEDCAIFLRDNHPAYIDWDGFQRNLQRLSSHRRRGPEPSGNREVVSLLAGRVSCGRCGARMQPRYAPRLRYECARRALDYGEDACSSLPGEEIERVVAEQILVALEPASLELSLAACERIEAERAELDRHWQFRLERAQEEAQRAFRQYDAAEPENRLVVRTLERNWEETLQAVRTLQEEYDRFRASRAATLSPCERRSIIALSTSLPQLWNSPSTAVADKRRVVQLLLEKAVVTGSSSELVAIELHWMGGTVTRHDVTRRVRRWRDLSNYETLVAHVEELASCGATSSEIADRLNAQGYRTCRRTEFTAENVRQLRSRSAASGEVR
jgi:DNA invertase Pin-like site-specific DNA recombinase